MLKLYLTFKLVSSPFPQTFFRAENVKLIHAACFQHDWFYGYDFPQISHFRLLGEKMVLSGIKLFLKAGGRINYG